MALDIVSTLELKQRNYKNRIIGLNSKIKQCERAYESLIAFKKAVIHAIQIKNIF